MRTARRCARSRSEAAYTERNRVLVTSADLLVAVWTGRTGGGTAETVSLAHAHGTPVREVQIGSGLHRAQPRPGALGRPARRRLDWPNRRRHRRDGEPRPCARHAGARGPAGRLRAGGLRPWALNERT